VDGHIFSGLPFSWCSRYGHVNYPACRGVTGRLIRPGANENHPGGGISQGRPPARACSPLPGNHSPGRSSRKLRRRVHGPGSLRRRARGHVCRVSRRSGREQSYFPAHSALGPGRFRARAGPDCGPDGVDAAFMLFERGVGWLAGAVARVIWGAGRASVTVASPVPRLTIWMPRSCCMSCMNAATMSHGRADRTSGRGIIGYESSPGAQGHQR